MWSYRLTGMAFSGVVCGTASFLLYNPLNIPPGWQTAQAIATGVVIAHGMSGSAGHPGDEVGDVGPG